MSSGVTVDRGGPAGTELGQLCRAPYVPVHSTMGNLRVYPSPATPPPRQQGWRGALGGRRWQGQGSELSHHSWGRFRVMAILS